MKLSDFASYTLVHDIASSIYASAGAKSEKFAIMSAFHIIGSSAQLSWETASGISPCLYQIMSAPAGYGKDHYRKAIIAFLRAVDPALEAQKPGSVQGFITELISWNSLSFVIDEYDQWMEKILKNPGTAEIKDHMLSLYIGSTDLSGVQLKRNRTPQIERPRASVIGFCTTKGLISLMTRNILSGGFLSRVLVWDENQIEGILEAPKKTYIDPHKIEWLKKIYRPDGDKLQKTKDKNFRDYIDAEQKRLDYKHESFYHLCHIIEMDDAAKQYLSELRFMGGKRFNLESKRLHEVDGDNTGIISRYVFMVERLASILALSRSMDGTPIITSEDVRLADVIMYEHNQEINIMLERRYNSEYHRKINQLIEVFKNKKDMLITMNDFRHVFAGVEKHHRHKMLLSLYEDGMIYILQNGKPVSEDALKFDKIPHGSTYQSTMS